MLNFKLYKCVVCIYYNNIIVCMWNMIIGMPEQALGWLPLGLGLVMEDEPSETSCMCTKKRSQI